MPRASRSRSGGPALTIRVGGLAAILVGTIVAACSATGATPLHSIVIDSTPTPPPGERARHAFVERVIAGDLTYHATFDGYVYGAGNDLPVTGSLDVAGADYQLAATYTLPKPPRPPKPPTMSYAIRYVGATAWVRIDGGKWTKDATFLAAESNSPFAFVTRDQDVKFLKTETVSGKSFHHVTLERSQVIGLSQIRVDTLTDEELTRLSLEVLLDDDGNPASGTARIEGVGRVSGHLREIIVQLDLVFSNVGAAIVIKAP